MNSTTQVLLALSPTATASLYAVMTEATPTQYALVGLVITAIVSPFLVWMMRNQDRYRVEASKLASRREERIDHQIEIQASTNKELERIVSILNKIEDRLELAICKYAK